MADHQEMDTALRDAIHETTSTRCSQGSDRCPDWPLAHALGNALRKEGWVLVDSDQPQPDAPEGMENSIYRRGYQNGHQAAINRLEQRQAEMRSGDL